MMRSGHTLGLMAVMGQRGLGFNPGGTGHAQLAAMSRHDSFEDSPERRGRVHGQVPR